VEDKNKELLLLELF